MTFRTGDLGAKAAWKEGSRPPTPASTAVQNPARPIIRDQRTPARSRPGQHPRL